MYSSCPRSEGRIVYALTSFHLELFLILVELYLQRKKKMMCLCVCVSDIDRNLDCMGLQMDPAMLSAVFSLNVTCISSALCVCVSANVYICLCPYVCIVCICVEVVLFFKTFQLTFSTPATFNHILICQCFCREPSIFKCSASSILSISQTTSAQRKRFDIQILHEKELNGSCIGKLVSSAITPVFWQIVNLDVFFRLFLQVKKVIGRKKGILPFKAKKKVFLAGIKEQVFVNGRVGGD